MRLNFPGKESVRKIKKILEDQRGFLLYNEFENRKREVWALAEKLQAEKKSVPIIQVKNLYKIYRVGDSKVYALGGVDFTINRGEFCAIVGPSG